MICFKVIGGRREDWSRCREEIRFSRSLLKLVDEKMVAYYIIVSTFPCLWHFWWKQALFLVAGLLPTLESKEDKRTLHFQEIMSRFPRKWGMRQHQGNFLGALVPVAPWMGACNRTAPSSSMAGECLHQPLCGKHLWLYLLNSLFPPDLFWMIDCKSSWLLTEKRTREWELRSCRGGGGKRQELY